MARTTKKETALTAEEKLAQALVPEAEQPYQVPGNWCWVRLDSSYIINPKIQADDELDAAFIPMEKISAGTDSSFSFDIQPWGKAKKGHTQFADGDVAFAKISPCFENGKSMMIQGLPNGIGGGTTELIILRQPLINQRFTYWLISTDTFIRGGCKTYSGTVGQQRISMDYVKSYPVPLPPLAEQQRIVERIESLFAKLDEAKEKAQAVIDGFEERKAAILHRAFTGELTAGWRIERGVLHSDWLLTTVGEYTDLITKGASPRWQGVEYTDDKSQTLFVTSENVREGYIDWSKEKYIDSTINDIQKRSILQKGDVLLNIVGASIGRSAIFDRDCLANTNQAVCLVRVKPQLLNVFLCYYFNSPFALFYYDESKVETARANISLTNINEMPITLPSLVEQQEIVKLLDELLEKETQAKEAAEQVIKQIDIMKKSILARAFRGQLGTNDPADESAVELLRRVL